MSAWGRIDIFEGLTAQQAVKDKLSGLLLRGTPGHAHLFSGASGVGKRSFAEAFAKALSCANANINAEPCDGSKSAAGETSEGTYGGADSYVYSGSRADAGLNGSAEINKSENSVGSRLESIPCGECLSCRLFGSGASDSFMRVEPSGQGQKPVVSVDSVRSVVNWLATRPVHSFRKIYIISQADRMTEQAQNALLKTLEEPPSYAVAILTAENTGMLSETILSRCSATRFFGYSEAELTQILDGRPDPSSQLPADAVLLARMSAGSAGRMLELAQSKNFFVLRGEIIDLFCKYLDGDAYALYSLTAFLDRNREHFIALAGVLIQWLTDIRNSLLSGADAAGARLVNADRIGEIAAFADRSRSKAATGRSGRAYLEALLESVEIIDETCSAVAANVNFSLAAGSMLLRISRLLNGGSDIRTPVRVSRAADSGPGV